MYLEKVEIKNIRNIEHLVLEFPNSAGWHVLIGDNGAGKTSILRAIAIGLVGPKDINALRLDLNNFIRQGKGIGEIEIQISRDNLGAMKVAFELAKSVESFYFKNNDIEVVSNWFSVSYGPFRRFTGGNKEWDKVYQSNPQAACHLSLFGEDVALTESLEWLVQLNYQKLEKDETSAQLLDDLTTFINKGKLLPHNAQITSVSSRGVKIKDGNGVEVSITETSDGFRSILSLTFELLRQMVRFYGADKVFIHVRNGEIKVDLPGIVIIDEIDVHLHPSWQTKVGEWFTSYFQACSLL